MLDSNIICRRYLNILYKTARHGCAQTIPETYGEILPESIDKLLSRIPFHEEDIFLDVGSGIGKVAIQFFLQSNIKEARGIEIIPELHLQALSAKQRVQSELPEFFANERKLTFILGNFLEVSFAEASILLICSVCYTQRMLHDLGVIINNTPSIHTVLTLRPIPNLERLSFKKIIRLECSWDSALCYVYSVFSGTRRV